MTTMNVARNTLMALLAVATFAGTAEAAVKHEGSWPDGEKTISLDADNLTRDQAIKRIADAAGWSIVVKAPARDGAPLALHVKDQSASKILDLVLSDGDYVAKRDGTIVSILPGTPSAPAAADDDDAHGDKDTEQMKKDAKSLAASAIAAAASAMNAANNPPGAIPPLPPLAPIPPLAPLPPVPPAFSGHHKHHGDADRVVTGGHVTIEKGETVGDVTVLGGSLDVFGDVEGDLAVFGGESTIHEGGEVHGDAVTLGGSLTVDNGAEVDGDVSVIGGSLHRADKAKIGGSARDDKGELKVSIDTDDDDEKASSKPHPHLVSHLASSLSESALMFVFGAVLLALLTKRVDALKVEVASRPMRSFALGIVGSIVGVIALVALCITIVGIPLAIVGILAAMLAVYGSITAVLTTVGQALLHHKTTNPYMHLALGCALLFILGSIPVVGGFAIAVVVFTAIGALVATRAAGLVPPRARQTPTDPYRTAASP